MEARLSATPLQDQFRFAVECVLRDLAKNPDILELGSELFSTFAPEGTGQRLYTTHLGVLTAEQTAVAQQALAGRPDLQRHAQKNQTVSELATSPPMEAAERFAIPNGTCTDGKTPDVASRCDR